MMRFFFISFTTAEVETSTRESLFIDKCTCFYKFLFRSPMAFMAPFMSSMSSFTCRGLSTVFAYVRFLASMSIYMIFQTYFCYKSFGTESTFKLSIFYCCMFHINMSSHCPCGNDCATHCAWYFGMFVVKMNDS